MTKEQLEDLGMHTEEDITWELDPVCGMEINPESTQFHIVHGSKEYFFCNKNCLGHFKDNPEQYVL